VLLPSLLTLAMSRLDYADHGRGTGLCTAAFFRLWLGRARSTAVHPS